MTENEFYRACPHCGGKNTGYWITDIEETEWFTTRIVDREAKTVSLFACGNANRTKCPHFNKSNSEGDDERFRKLNPLEQVHELEDLVEEVEDEIDEAERKQTRRH